ncbi:cellulose-binding protein [Streptomyces canus]|uniref:cellulose-binding protein n=1 Tax=Streptomyces canus TaxID=58343 RepID=UPI002E2A4A55|nr:cellulose-binding protein [Streptomyces canus]
MSSAPVSPQGFVAVRGRGYRPEEVDAYAAALSQDRDAAWERAARLTVLAREMEAELVLLREVVAGLAPQAYEALGEGARRLFEMVQEEAADVRERARQEAQRLADEAQAHADGVRDAAQAHADTVLGEADERARQRLLVARAEADEIRVAARREVKAGRGEELAALRDVRQRTIGMLAEQAEEHAERWAEVERAEERRAAEADARGAERVARAEAALSAAKREFAEAEASAGPLEEDARARAAEILAEALVQEERIAGETERLLRKHAEHRDEVQAQMDHVRSSLTALTGTAATE